MLFRSTNTDVAGFVSPLAAMERDWSATTAAILGNGGAARAVVVGCHQLGCGEIHVVGRDAAKLAQFQSSWSKIKLTVNGSDTPTQVTISTHLWAELPGLINRDNLLLVNSTPIGMYPQVDSSPINQLIMRGIGANSIAYDLIYTPRPTKFLQLAKEAAMITIDGTEMLVQQGAAAFELWLKQPAPIQMMRQALIQILNAN